MVDASREDTLTLDDRRLRVEERKIALEEQKFSTEQAKLPIWRQHFGAMVAAVASLAAVLVSGSQVWVAHVNKEKELRLAELRAKQELTLQEQDSERRWKLDLAEFLVSNRSLIFSRDAAERRQIRDILLVGFPADLNQQLFRDLAIIDAPEWDAEWRQAEMKALALQQPVVYAFYASTFPKDMIDSIADVIIEGEYVFAPVDQEVPSALATGKVLYYSDANRKWAEDLQRSAQAIACYKGYDLELTVQYRESPTRPKGVLEIWFPPELGRRKGTDKDCDRIYPDA